MKKITATSLLRPVLALWVLALVQNTAWARPLSVRVEKVTGQVSAVLKTGKRPLTAGARLAEGDKIETGSGGTVILVWETGHVVKLGPISAMVLKSAQQSARKETTKMQIDKGSVFVRAAKLSNSDSSLMVQSVDLLAGVRGTSFNVTKPLKGPSIVAVLRGQVRVGAAGVERIVAAGMMVSGVKGQKPSEPKKAPASTLQQMQSDDSEAAAVQSSSIQGENSDAAATAADSAVDAVDQQIQNSILNQINEPGTGGVKFEVK